MSNDSQVIADKWSQFEPEMEKTYFGFSPLRPYLIEWAYSKELGEEHRFNRFWAEDILVSHSLKNKKVKSILSVCCGFGAIEQRIVSQLGGVERCLAGDLAPGAIEIARERAQKAGLGNIIEYQVVNLNTFEWPKEEYDLIIANGALHHLVELEKVLSGINRALKPDGMLYASEHVGASYQDFPIRQLELINASSYLLPPELRGRIGTPFRHDKTFLTRLHKLYHVLCGRIPLPDPETIPTLSNWQRQLLKLIKKVAKENLNTHDKFRFGIVHDTQKKILLKTDPSEGVRSAEIIPLIKYFFSDVEVRSYGGGILAYALDAQFYERFDKNNDVHQKTLNMLCFLDKFYLDTGQIGIEHAILTAKKQRKESST